MIRIFFGKIFALFLMVALLSPATILAGKAIFPFDDEKILLGRMGASPSGEDLKKLGRLRLSHGAGLYAGWQKDPDHETFAQALVYAQSAADLIPQSDEAWLLLGMLRAELKGDPAAMDAAAQALIRAVDLNPANGPAQLLLAQVLMEQGRYWSAIEQFKMLIKNTRAMRTGTVLSQLTFCYIADGRVQAGLDYILSLINTEPPESTCNQWLEWQLINTAVLMKAKGERENAIGYLNLMFFYGGKEDSNHQRTDGRIRQVRYLLDLWKKEV